MLRQYMDAAMRHARFEMLPQEGQWYGEVPECNGVYSTAETPDRCRQELEEVLEEWILLRIHKHLPLPVIDGVELAVKSAT